MTEEKENVVSEVNDSVNEPEKKKSNKAIRITIISLIEVLIFFVGAVGGYFFAVLTAPPSDVDAEYVSYETLLEVYKPSQAEDLKSVSSCGNDYYLLYKKAYYKLLTAKSVYSFTTGYTMSAGVKVDIDNRRYLQDGYFYMHTISKGTSPAFAGLTDNNLQAVFDIQNKMVKLREMGENAFTEMSEEDYVESYGILQYAHSNYTITKKTILDGSSIEKDGDLNKLTLKLHPTKSTVNLVVQMQTMSSSAVTYKGGSVTFTVWFDDDFVIRKAGVVETYKAKGMACSAETTDTYYYGEEVGFVGYPATQGYENPEVRTEHFGE